MTRPAAGGDQDDRHPDALGDGPDRRAGARERQPAARRAVLRRPDRRRQDRARQDADPADLRRRARLHPLRHERIRRGAHRRPPARRAARLHRLRRRRRAHQRGAREAVLGRAVRRNREGASAHPRQVPADPRGRTAHRRPRRDRLLLRGDPRVHVQPRHLRRGRARPARAERAARRRATTWSRRACAERSRTTSSSACRGRKS